MKAFLAIALIKAADFLNGEQVDIKYLAFLMLKVWLWREVLASQI